MLDSYKRGAIFGFVAVARISTVTLLEGCGIDSAERLLALLLAKQPLTLATPEGSQLYTSQWNTIGPPRSEIGKSNSRFQPWAEIVFDETSPILFD